MFSTRTVFPHLVLALLATLVACRERSQPAPAAGASADAAGALAASAPGTAALPLQLPIQRPIRGVDFAVYSPLAPPAPVVAQAQEAARKRFAGFDVHTAPPPGTKPPTVLVFAPPIASFAPPTEQQLPIFGRGLDAPEMHAAATSTGVLVLSWLFDDDPKHARLREAQQLALDLASTPSSFVWDEDTRQLFSRDFWRTNRVDGWEGDVPDMRHHVTVHYYEADGNRHRSVTLGMVKFGLPDLVVDDAPISQSNAVGWVLDVIAQALVEGASPGADGALAIDVGAIRHGGARAGLAAAMGADVPHKGTVTLVAANAEKGDPTNRLVALRFPSYAGRSDAERQAAGVASIAGVSEEQLAQAKENDPELRAVAERVQARLPQVAAAFRSGLSLGEVIAVKAPFPTDKGGVEWMWVEVSEWPSPMVRGHLLNAPRFIKSLRLGKKVEVKEETIADYVWHGADGGIKEGGESSEILRARERDH